MKLSYKAQIYNKMKWFKFWHIFTPITEIDIVHKVLKSEKKNHYITKIQLSD